MTQTIFAPITPLAKSAIITLRISGPKTLAALRCLAVTQNLKNRQATLCLIKNPKNSQIIDESLVTFFLAPNSFTGEDVAEISIHGSPFIAQKIMNILGEIPDIRLADPGEFSRRAFENNKIDLTKAEAIIDLVDSQTAAQHNQAIKQLRGSLGKIYENWCQELIAITAHLEAVIDFPDEDLPKEIARKVEENIRNLRAKIENHLKQGKIARKIHDGLKLAIIGAPNVGKSSLLNFLAGSEAAIVSEIAGTTRDVIDIHLDIAGQKVVISDTAGIRSSNDIIEQKGVKKARQKAEESDIKIFVSDVNNEQFIAANLADENSIFLVNKADANPNFKPRNMAKFLPILISLKDKTNLEQFLALLSKKVQDLTPQSDGAFLTRKRHEDALNEALNYLQDFNLSKEIELAGEDLRLALRAIGKITGRVDVDQILDVIFADFCLGK